MERMERLTAVEWLVEQWPILESQIPERILEQAKEMEKEQIVNADLNATIRTAKGVNADVSVTRVKELAEKYYNETFKSE
jgi:hypothetical protein